MWFALLACATWHPPGPLGKLGKPPVESAADWIARRTEPKSPSPDAPSARPPNVVAREVVEAAERFVGRPQLAVDGTSYRFDCSGLVEASLASAGRSDSGSSAMLYEHARELGVLHHRRKPQPGDIAFFDNTYDRDKNGRIDDPLSHSAVVVGVEANGRIEMVHLGSKGVVRIYMNLADPDIHEVDGAVMNDYLRAAAKRDPDSTKYLAGQLWTGFASFWAAKTQ